MSKLRPRNFPTFLLEGLYAVAQAGEEKYGTYDFLNRDYTVNDHLDALKRHLMRYEDPKQSDLDEDSNRSHLYHVAWRALVAAYVAENRPNLDDRYSPKKEPNVEWETIENSNQENLSEKIYLANMYGHKISLGEKNDK